MDTPKSISLEIDTVSPLPFNRKKKSRNRLNHNKKNMKIDVNTKKPVLRP